MSVLILIIWVWKRQFVRDLEEYPSSCTKKLVVNCTMRPIFFHIGIDLQVGASENSMSKEILHSVGPYFLDIIGPNCGKQLPQTPRYGPPSWDSLLKERAIPLSELLSAELVCSKWQFFAGELHNGVMADLTLYRNWLMAVQSGFGLTASLSTPRPFISSYYTRSTRKMPSLFGRMQHGWGPGKLDQRDKTNGVNQ